MSFLTKSADENFKYYMKYDFKFCRQLLFVVVHSYFQVAKYISIYLSNTVNGLGVSRIGGEYSTI